MSDTPTPEQLWAEHDRVPNWYAEIFPAGKHDGFYERLGEHALSFVERSTQQLVVSFDNLSDAGYPYHDVTPWGEKMIRENGWSHLGVYSRGPSWYRDARIIARLEKLAADGFFARFDRVALIGTSMGAYAALAFADLAPGATVVALSPQSTLDTGIVPWETRFVKGQARDWTLPRADAATTLGGVGKAYVLYDPFFGPDVAHIARLPQDRLVHLRAPGLGHKSAVVLRRMEKLRKVMEAAIAGTLTPVGFAAMIRNRKDVLLYRRNIEAYLAERDRDSLIPRFTAAFRQRRLQAAAEAAASEGWGEDGDDKEGEPEARAPSAPPPAPARTAATSHSATAPEPSPGHTPARAPRTRGNVWMLEETPTGVLRFMSDLDGGRVEGFEDRGGKVLPQSADLALATVHFGGGGGNIPRPLPERFPYHVIDPALDGNAPDGAARAQGAIAQSYHRAAGLALPTIIAVAGDRPGLTAAEAEGKAAPYRNLLEGIENARHALRPWDKALFVDRVTLALLAAEALRGADGPDEGAADAHYADVAQRLRRDITAITGQASFPPLIVAQSAGSRKDGRAGVILAEGRLSVDHPRLGFIVATPKYPFAMSPDLPASHTPEALLAIDELCHLALAQIRAGRRWQCPLMRFAGLSARTVTAEFSALGDLVLGDGPHGFAIEGAVNDPRITAVHAEGRKVRLVLNKAPEGEGLHLAYAFGMQADGSARHAANQGALRDDWGQASLVQPGLTLRRHALSARVKIVRTA
ncbi:hypothetical protein LX70_02826 [Defluviimonas denitrificans]|uniref:Uncharacterized protein n=1 Tax=Albidovulum denitrificans TaxID=404881 RepID=A0A2S8S554_9RHOB|nr:hypothetical protein [Defluviimonas denitrificans]PQV55941.1 hypothetical protein LX70_02826 [Defluviimonas denitrificans]